MKQSETDILIEKFFNGETTEEEEKLLHEASLNAPLGSDKKLFQSEAENEHSSLLAQRSTLNAQHSTLTAQHLPLLQSLTLQPEVPLGLEQRLSRQIDQWNSIEKRSEKRVRTAVMRWTIGIAAGIALIVGIAIPTLREPDAVKYAEEQETYNDPEMAQREAEKALAKFSDCINKGFDIMDKTTNKNVKQ